MSHDVDWRRQGPPPEHILARKDRFEEPVIRALPGTNPYRNFARYMELEEKFGVRSTFFFRTMYENGDCADYADDIAELGGGGWEIGLHLDPSSVSDVEKIRLEKSRLEELSGSEIRGNRVHYLSNDPGLPGRLGGLGFSYDSSNKISKDDISVQDMGYSRTGGIIEFPVTVMDTYLFMRMGIKEAGIIPAIKGALLLSRGANPDAGVVSLLWHDNVLQMKGGRMYPEILEFLASQDDVRMCRGIDLCGILG